jgi:Protein of unknown function, DUF547
VLHTTNSLAELEHCIIRAKMTPPRQFLSKFVLPSSSYPFALRHPDPRVNFALNCGSESGVQGITVYTAAAVDQQLDLMSMLYLQETVTYNAHKIAVTLPRMMQWYQGDFGKSPLEALRIVIR